MERINFVVRDESEDEGKEEENVEEEVVLKPKEDRLFRVISKIGKDLSLRFPNFQEILTQRS